MREMNNRSDIDKIKALVKILEIELSNGSHANILIWDITKKVISRFEPHGNSHPSQLIRQ